MSVAVDSSQELNRMTKPALAALASGLQDRVRELESENAELRKALGESDAADALARSWAASTRRAIGRPILAPLFRGDVSAHG